MTITERMMSNSVLQRLGAFRIVPVVEVTSVDRAVRLAGVLAEAGLPVLEITLRTPVALDAIMATRRERPDVFVGAGTILDRARLEAAVAAGAQFGVSPGFDPSLSEAARDARFPYLPGATTATEIQVAVAAGHRILKFFPAEAAGGVPAIRALAGAFGHEGVRFVPTGGIDAGNAAAYLAQPSVLAVGGTWLAPRDEIEAAQWETIRRRTAERFASSRQRESPAG